MLAKFSLVKVERNGSDTAPFENLTFTAVTDKPFDKDGQSEDNDFARWTPCGQLTMTVTNPALVGTFVEGTKYYLSFTPAAQ